MTYELFINAYTVTSMIMFPILVFIVALLIRDLSNYSKVSEKINKILKNLSEDLEDKNFKKEHNENVLKHINRYINKK